MADGTVRGAFDLDVHQAVSGLTSIRDRGAEADATLERLGSRMDSLSSTSTRMAQRVDASWRATSRSVSTQADQIDARLDRLEVKLRNLGSVTARPTVDLTGIDRANAALSELELRLDRLSRQSASPRVSIAGGMGGGGGVAGAAGGGGRAFSSPGGIAGALPWWAMAAPLAPALGGSAIALAGSAGSAAMGAGVLGLGGMATAGVGGGLSMLAARPAIKGLSTLEKAHTAYTQAYATYGPRATQTLNAYRTYQAALRADPGGARALGGLDALTSSYTSSFAAARGQVYAGMGGVFSALGGAMPAIGASANVATNATAGAATSYARFLTAPQQLGVVGSLSSAFARDLPLAERSLEHITTIFGRLAVDATPFFHEALTWADHWTRGMATASGNTERVTARMQGYVNSARDWARLTGAAFRDIRDILQAGAPSGDSMVVQLTHTLDRWDQWINTNPQKVTGFFTRAQDTTTAIASTVGHLVRDIAQIATYLDPIVHRATQLLSLVSGMGPGGLGIAGAVGFGGYSGVRSALGGRGPSAMSLAGAFVTGSATPSFGRGARLGGGAVIGGGAAEAGVARSYLVPRAGFQTARTAAGLLEQNALFATVAGQTIGRRAAPALARGAVATPEAFNAAYGGVEGARFAGLTSEIGATETMLARAGGLARTALAGAARVALPVLAITSALQGMQAPGNVGHKIQAGVDTAFHLGTFGILPSNTIERLAGNVNAGASLSNAGAQASLRALAARAGAVSTPAQMRAVQSTAAQARIGAYELSPQDAATLNAQLTRISNTAAANAGISASNTWETSFQTGLSREPPNRAVNQMLSGMTSQLRSLGPQGAAQFASSTAQWVHQLEVDNPKLTGPLQRLMRGIVGDINQMHDHALGRLKHLRDQVFFYNGQIFTGTDKTWGNIRDSLVNKASVAQEKLSGVWASIQSQAIDALTQMGYTRSQARTIVTDTARGGQSRANAGASLMTLSATGQAVSPLSTTAPGLPRRARGGVIGGTGLLDTVRTPDGGTAAPGEAWIANRHTMMALSSATLAKYGKTAWQMIRDEGRPHSAPMRARGGAMVGGVAASAYGGYSLPLPGAQMNPGSWSIDQGVDISAPANTPEYAIGPGVITGAGISGFGPNAPILRITSGPLAGSSVYYGHAGPNVVPVGARVSAGQQITEVGAGRVGISTGPHLELGFYPPGGASSGSAMATVLHQLLSGARVTGVNGGLGGAQGALASAISLRAPSMGLGGVPGALGDQAGRVYAAGLTGMINRLTGAGGISGAGFTGGGAPTANQALGRRMMQAAGWGIDQWPSLLALWNQESGWNANATNPSSGAYGIPQSLGHGHPYNLGDAPAQIAWGLNYIRGRYGSPMAAEAHERAFNWYSRGGRVNWAGWRANGGTFTTNGPTMFGAGEKGRRETITVTPAGAKPGHTIHITMQNVNLGMGDQESLRRVAEDVAGKIIDALDGTSGGASDRQLAGVR